ncbi:uncharacterized protein LOC110344238 [Heterocephalus glaber]|uniref:Uncharacterized protein LOC110344238 n=1 Tax=Heterocephalus glaber TaxID=10181 RepID=A0AAX6R8H7_HETGA|nr:uncharacterized protein LOC110344238 [Heterocephalus glaber]
MGSNRGILPPPPSERPSLGAESFPAKIALAVERRLLPPGSASSPSCAQLGRLRALPECDRPLDPLGLGRRAGAGALRGRGQSAEGLRRRWPPEGARAQRAESEAGPRPAQQPATPGERALRNPASPSGRLTAKVNRARGRRRRAQGLFQPVLPNTRVLIQHCFLLRWDLPFRFSQPVQHHNSWKHMPDQAVFAEWRQWQTPSPFLPEKQLLCGIFHA